MNEFTLTNLQQVMREAAGDDGHLTDDALDTDFTELGFDSLALLEAAARVHQSLGVRISDDDVTDLTTPRSFLDLVNSQLEPTA